ncbi:MAG TPA: (2Fe-2S)-binding protein [Bacillota bacterium]|nr:(2Fe-2S)-binding protein [Bacillota bacterium]
MEVEPLTDVVVCRCQGIGGAEVLEAVATHGLATCDQVKKLTGAGMGPCQGRVCGPLLRSALLAAGVREEPGPLRVRPPLRLVAMGLLAAGAESLDQPRGTVSAKVLWGLSEGDATLTLEPEGPSK